MIDGADGQYGYRAWDRRPGDGVDPSVLLNAQQTVDEIEALNPLRPEAGQPLRFLGYERPEPGIVDVLGVGPAPLMQDTETRQDSGMPGTLRPAW